MRYCEHDIEAPQALLGELSWVARRTPDVAYAVG